MKNWKKNSWRKYPVKHIPEYPDKKDLNIRNCKINFKETGAIPLFRQKNLKKSEPKTIWYESD